MERIDEKLQFLHSEVSIAKHGENGLVALDKGCGVLSRPNARVDERFSLLTCKYDGLEQAYICSNEKRVYLLNRLDSPVSGLILVGLNEKIAKSVRVAFKNRAVSKTYVALVKGHSRAISGTWRSRLGGAFAGGAVGKAVKYDSIAETKFECTASFVVRGVTVSTLNLHPITGKTHQLRMHCAQNNLPIVGDETYGDYKFNAIFRKNFKDYRLFLHSQKISLSYSMDGQIFDFCAESATDFVKILEKFRGK
jgi:23S rRNA-/tRNA-specific pseudouridylate synthase